MPLILEGVVTTQNDDMTVNVAPMGPIVDVEMRHLTLRPYQTSTTYRNLSRYGHGVLHVTDDVWLIAQAALGPIDPPPRLAKCPHGIDGWILADACRWYAFEVRRIDDRAQRTEITADVVATGHLRDFFGFNRAKHAVIEAAILATRVDLLPPAGVRQELVWLESMVRKTAGEQEERAFEWVKSYILARLPEE